MRDIKNDCTFQRRLLAVTHGGDLTKESVERVIRI